MENKSEMDILMKSQEPLSGHQDPTNWSNYIGFSNNGIIDQMHKTTNELTN